MPLNNGIWEYDENETVSPTYSEHLNKLGDSVRAVVNPSLVAGSWSGAFATNFKVATGEIEVRGTEVEMYGAITTKVAISIATGASYTVGTVTPAPRRNVHVEVPTQGGSLELLILATGVAALRNWSGVTRNLPIGHFIGLGGVRYRTA